MKRYIFSIVICVVCCSSLYVLAQNDQNQAPPEGMEYIQISSGYRILVPKGMKLIPVGSYERVEKLDSYVARRFEEIEQRFKTVEASQLQMQGELTQLKATVAQLHAKMQQ